MPLAGQDRDVVRALVARLDVDALVDRVEAGMRAVPEYGRFVGGLDADRDRGRGAIRWNLSTFTRWLSDGRPPDAAELARLGDLVGVRAAEGRPPEEGVAVYREGLRMGWNALLAEATDPERAALSSAVDTFLAWLDVVSRAFAEVYAQRRDALISQPERRARRLLDRIAAGTPLATEDESLADALGFPLAATYRPLAVELPGASMLQHSDLAARLRAAGVLAATDGRCVVGLAHAPLDLAALRLGQARSAQDEAAPPAGLDDALADLRTVLRLAAAEGRHGAVDPARYLPELLALRAPDLAGKLQRRVFGALDAAGHGELAATLEVLADHGFERAATAAALPVHRNTLAHRLARIEALTGLDPDDPQDRGAIWLAGRIRASAA